MTAYGSLLTAGYTGDNLRAWKQTAAGRIYFLYDVTTPVIEMNGSGAVTAVNTFGATGLLSRHTSTGSVFYQFDPQGSVAQRLDANQSVLSTFVFDAYGKELAGGSAGEPWGYEAQAGYFTDGETGLILCTRRYYDPIAGSWLDRDPIGVVGGINLYGYVANDPTSDADPTGEGGILKQIRKFCDWTIHDAMSHGTTITKRNHILRGGYIVNVGPPKVDPDYPYKHLPGWKPPEPPHVPPATIVKPRPSLGKTILKRGKKFLKDLDDAALSLSFVDTDWVIDRTLHPLGCKQEGGDEAFRG